MFVSSRKCFSTDTPRMSMFPPKTPEIFETPKQRYGMVGDKKG